MEKAHISRRVIGLVIDSPTGDTLGDTSLQWHIIDGYDMESITVLARSELLKKGIDRLYMFSNSPKFNCIQAIRSSDNRVLYYLRDSSVIWKPMFIISTSIQEYSDSYYYSSSMIAPVTLDSYRCGTVINIYTLSKSNIKTERMLLDGSNALTRLVYRKPLPKGFYPTAIRFSGFSLSLLAKAYMAYLSQYTSVKVSNYNVKY